jgi:hypothetical protein
MSSIGVKTLIIKGFKNAAASDSLQGNWWSDKTLLQVLMDHFELSGILHEDHTRALTQRNSSISRAPEFDIIDTHFPANQSGIFRMKMSVVCVEISSGCLRVSLQKCIPHPSVRALTGAAATVSTYCQCDILEWLPASISTVCVESRKQVQRYFYYFSGNASKGPIPLTITIAQKTYDKMIRTSERMSKRH